MCVLEVTLKGVVVNCINAGLEVVTRRVFTVPCPKCCFDIRPVGDSRTSLDLVVCRKLPTPVVKRN